MPRSAPEENLAIATESSIVSLAAHRCPDCNIDLVHNGFNYRVQLAWHPERESDSDPFPTQSRDPDNDQHYAECRACGAKLDQELSLHLYSWFLSEYGIRFESLRWCGIHRSPRL
jgi:hypothetical protein